MREILFRAKWIDDGEWVYGHLVYRKYLEGRIEAFIISNEDDIHIYVDDEIHCRLYEVDSATVGQFTGLHGKNGKKIFEGDIVKCGTNKAGAVEYDPYEALYHVGNDPLQYYVYGSAEPETMRVEIEIIGNIHDKDTP